VTHAEWYVEVTDTYCWTLMLANQLGSPITHISTEKNDDLLELKKKLNLPDARHDMTMQECKLCDLPEFPGGIAVVPSPISGGPANGATSVSSSEIEAIVKSVTDSVMAAMSQVSH
jgi:L-fuculose-phosphate aldolase